jgi:hypothetical protein
MDYHIEEIAPDVWHVEIAGTTRIVRRSHDTRTFAPWDISTADGHRLWASPTLESAFRWIQARTGHPTEALLAEGLLEHTASRPALPADAAEAHAGEDERAEAMGR